MRRQFSMTVINETKRMVEVTGDSVSIEVIVSDTSERKNVTFNVMTNRSIDSSRILFEERQEEIYLTIMDCGEGIKGVARAYIPKANNFIVCHKAGTYYYQADKHLLTIRRWKDGKKEDIPLYYGKLRRILVGETKVKISFYDRENVIMNF